MRLILLVLVLLAFPSLAAAQSTATYRVTFESTWSAATHPDDFPPDPHYSGLIGGVHNASAVLWAEGELSSTGIKNMAETGSKNALRDEVEAHIAAGRALAVASGGGIGNSPGNVTMEFDVTEVHPLVTLVSMLAPSPDWFVGVAGFDLRDGTTWTGSETVTLYVYDAGTDSGSGYTSPNQPTTPAVPVAMHIASPFLVDGAVVPVGTFTFTLLSVTASDDAAPPAAFGLGTPAPNPATAQTTFTLRLDTAQPVRIDAFDVLGRRVATLHDGVLPAGARPFSLDVSEWPAGVYFVRAQGTEAQATRRIVVR